MVLLCNKPTLRFGGKTYQLGQPIPFHVVGKNVAALRAAGKIRTADLTEREGYTHGSRFKKYEPPFFGSFVDGESTVSASLALDMAFGSSVENQSGLSGAAGLSMQFEGTVEGEAEVIGDAGID